VKRRIRTAIVGLALALVAPRHSDAATPSPEPLPTLRSRFGVDVASRLMRSGDPDERLRGIDRASAIRTPEALALLIRASAPTLQSACEARSSIDGVARCDPRALLSVVRGLATWAGVASARQQLVAILEAPTPSFATHVASLPSRDPSYDEAQGSARVALARKQAAIALARSGNGAALETLVTVARSGETGQEAAIEALDVEPPEGPAVLGGVALATRPTIALAARLGDLRTLDSILGIIRTSDAGLRAAAIDALGGLGDTRVLDVARASLRDSDARVRLAAAGALARLATPDAGEAVEAAIADKQTALEALAFAQRVQSDGVTRAVAALAAASADGSLRAAALAALGRQKTPLAVRALMTLGQDPRLEGDAACAIARSPSAVALGALEQMTSTSPRLAARAYLVRRFVRGERSIRLDALLRRLAASGDGRDRAVGMEALVGLGEGSLDRALADRDPRVRRAGAAAALASRDARQIASLRAHIATEPDETTRQVLSVGLVDGDPDATVPTSILVDRARSGGPDAPLAALAFARRADTASDETLSALLESSDPVLRAHAARGLGLGAAADAAGRLVQAYAFETEAEVRRAIVAALAARESDAGATTLALAAELDPDAAVRSMAKRALRGVTPAVPSLVPEVAWLRVLEAEGAERPLEMTGTLIESDGLAVPIAFDDEGYALVPGVVPGEARLHLAPRLPAYLAPSP
jgi:HEAT repeat protein